MTDESRESTDAENLDAVADRLEAALERIVRHVESPRPGMLKGEIALRLDRLIARLRDALGTLDEDEEETGEDAGEEEAGAGAARMGGRAPG